MLSRNPGIHLPLWQGAEAWRRPLERTTCCNDGNPFHSCKKTHCSWLRPGAHASQVSQLPVQSVRNNIHLSEVPELKGGVNQGVGGDSDIRPQEFNNVVTETGPDGPSQNQILLLI